MKINGRELSTQEHDALRDMALLGLMSPHIKEYMFNYWNILFGRLFPEQLVIRKVSPNGITDDEQEMRKKLTEILMDPEAAMKIFEIVDKRDSKEGWKILFVRRIRKAHMLGKIDDATRTMLLHDLDDELFMDESKKKLIMELLEDAMDNFHTTSPHYDFDTQEAEIYKKELKKIFGDE